MNKIIYNIISLAKNEKCFNIINKIGSIDNYNLIIPNLYLGNIKTSYDINFLNKHNIKAIVNCTKNEPYSDYFKDKKVFRLDVDDSKEIDNINNFKNNIMKAIEFIDINLKENNSVYVHCYWGLMRSATVVAGYLITKYKISYIDAIAIIKEKRPKALSIFYNFNDVLKHVEEKTNNQYL
jgi:protein-tyrosine phosphatase